MAVGKNGTHMDVTDINKVKTFWENHPLFYGESDFELDDYKFFEEHRETVLKDCFAGELDTKIFPAPGNMRNILDLGCGTGFWVIELLKMMQKNDKITAADLTDKALSLTQKRCEFYGYSGSVEIVRQNAENMNFPDAAFSHVNCQGVIHHTPNTEKCVQEIARVLKSGGTACISVYYKNAILRNWHKLSWMGKLLQRMGGRLKGRGRENIFEQTDIDEIVKLYDGRDNPIGKVYSKKEFVGMLSPYFEVNDIFYHFFPARTLPVRMPSYIHRILDKKLPFLIFAKLEKST